MKVKIGDKEYDAGQVPICIILSSQDKVNICSMPEENFRYAVYPDDVFSEREDVLNWMGEGEHQASNGK